MASSEKITGASPASFPGGCVEAEEEFETEVTEEEPPQQVTVCKTNENGFYLSDGRKILFTEASVTHLSEEDWVQYGLSPHNYKEGNYLMRSANLYAFLGPEFEEWDEEQCSQRFSTEIASVLMNILNKVREQLAKNPPLLRRHFVADLTFGEWQNYLTERGIEWGYDAERNAKRLFLAQPNMPADKVEYFYGTGGEFENLLVTIQGFKFIQLQNDFGEMDYEERAYWTNLLMDREEIEVLYANGEYTTIGIEEEIPDELRNALEFLALPYINGSFIDEQRDSAE